MNKKVTKSAFIYAASSVILNGISVIASPILTRLLTTEDYGIASNFNTWVSLLTTLIGLCLAYTLGNAKIEFINRFDEYIANIIIVSAIIPCILLITLPFTLELWENTTDIPKEIIWILFPFVYFSLVHGIIRSKYNFEYKYYLNSLLAVIPAILSVMLSVIFIVCMDNKKYIGKVYGNCIPVCIIGFVYAVYFIVRKSRKKTLLSDAKYGLAISLPLVPHGLAMNVLTQIDRVMIIRYCGNSPVGLYSYGYAIGNLVSLFSNSFCQAVKPWIYEKYSKQEFTEIRFAKRKLVYAMGGLLIAFSLVSPEIVKLLADKKFWDSAAVIPPVAVVAYCQFVYSFYTDIETYHKKTIIVAGASAFAALCNYILNRLFIPVYGYAAAAYTTLAGYCILMIVHMIACRRVAKRSVYSEKSELLVFSVCTFLIPFYLQIQKYYLIRWFLVFIVMFLLLYVYKREIVGYFKRKK